MKPLIVANWKMNPQSLKEAERLFAAVKNIKAAKVVICPPFVYLKELSSFQRSLAPLGAQDVFWGDSGAYTGEISPIMLKNMGVKYVIIGHSERRKYQKETNEIIAEKLKAALKIGLKPILCIDKISQIPSLAQRGEVRDEAKPQRPPKGIKNLIIAYEPLFAIGTGKACNPQRAKKMRLAIEKAAGSNNLILYGGSVNSQNANSYIKEAGFQGLLVGGASLKPKEFIDIIKNVCYH